MSEFSLSRTEKSGLPSFLLSDLFNLCFFVLSHPLYFSYFIFFSPYLFKIFSFLSPLFITTTLLLLAFLSATHVSSSDSSEPKLSYLAATYQAVSERLRSKADGDNDDEGEEEFRRFEESEVYKIVFETSTFEVRDDPFEVLEEVVKETCLEATEAPVDKCLIHEDNAAVITKENSAQIPAENVSDDQKELAKPLMVGIPVESLKWCLQEERGLENMSRKKEDKEDTEVKPWVDNVKESEKVDQDAEKDKEVLFKRSGSKVMTLGNRTFQEVGKLSSGSHEYYNFASPDRRFDHQYSWKSSMDDSQGGEFDSSLGSYGSMRKEKEWRRTLACKLFEERHNHVDGGEGMDLLWETYETSDQSNTKVQAQSRSNSKKGKKSVNSSSVEYSDFDDEYEEDEDEAEAGQLCCLQALKFSAGKMNLGMGRPNLVKISKALKGIGWFTHVGRHGKKRYH